jgi:type I restriction enzyme S subunit
MNSIVRNKLLIGWKSVPVKDAFVFVKSYAFSRDSLINDTSNKEGVGNIHYGDIHAKFSTPNIDLRQISVPMIRNLSFTPDSEDFLKDGDLIMADTSEDYEGIGVTVSIHGIGNKKIVGGLHTFVLRDDKGNTNDYYRQYIFRNPKIRNLLQKLANGVSVYGISKTAVSKLLLPLPPLLEQSRIVAILETWDKAIEKLTKKIEIKKKVKKGLMQELLTGKTRLPGFENKWQVKRLGECLLIRHGRPQREVESPNGIYPILGTGGEFGRSNDFLYDKPSVLIGRKGTIDKPKYIDSPFWTVDTLFYSEIKDNHSAKFLYYKFLMINWKSYNEGSGVPSLSASTISSIKVSLPTDHNEEIELSKVLTTFDDDISTLDHKLSLLKDQKKYLLNNLITGTIRTPEKMKIIKLPC